MTQEAAPPAMKPDASRLRAAIDRNFSEANSALHKLTAWQCLRQAGIDEAGADFFAITRQALYNDMLAGAIRIFDDHKEAAALWYIIRCCGPFAHRAAQACGIDLDKLQKVIPKLRHVRDRFHFHIDRRSVEHTAPIWRDAGMTEEELGDALRDAARLLAKIRQESFGGELAELPVYDGSDVKRIIDAAKKAL